MPRKSSNSVRIYYPKYSRDELISLLRERAHVLSKEIPLKLVILFGSWAEGRHTAASDVDLLVVVEGEKDYSRIREAFGIRNLELFLYDVEEYRSGVPIIKEAEKKGVIIYRA